MAPSGVNSGGGLIAELNRRNVFRVALFYVVSAWVIVQVAETLLPVFDVPDSSIRVVVLVLALGFPLTLLFAWIFELTPEGLKLDKNARVDPAVKQQTTRKLNWATLIVAVLAIGLLVLDRMLPEPASVQPAGKASAELQSTPVLPADEPDPASIAVLPFDDLSPQGDQEYFSHGIAEEILNVLVRVEGLEVASRTSAFRLGADAELSIPAMARELDVRHILEGSVRKAGDTIRVTAQLIDGTTDKHLWSETYDRSLSAENVFAIQDEIATAIVAAMRQSIELPESLDIEVATSTDDLGAYELYLEARSLFLERRRLSEADALLARAVELDPGFARAWELRSALSMLMPEYGYDALSSDEAEQRSLEFAQKALSLDPNSALALATRANIAVNRNQALRQVTPIDQSIADLERALELDPQNASAMNWLGLVHLWLGDLDKALALFVRCNEIEPRYAPCRENQYDTLASMGRYEEAMANFRDALDRAIGTPYWVNFSLLAHFEEEVAFKALATEPHWLEGWEDTAALYEAYRDPDADHSALTERLKRFVERRHPDALRHPSLLAGLLIPLGVFDTMPFGLYLWSPEYRRYRQSPQFRNLMIRSGTLDYWQKHGFPEGCRLLDENNFACD